ncbi:RtcB family protein [archaeon]|nr:RtcB family protein [archaeon]
MLSEFGYNIKISELEKTYKKERVKVFDEKNLKFRQAGIKKFFKLKPHTKVFKIFTESGKEIVATSDHPFYTKEGMKPLAKIMNTEHIAVNGFEGIPYKAPSANIVLNEDDAVQTLNKIGASKNRKNIIIKKLLNRDLLSISYNHPKLPYLIKIIGFVFGDGSMNFIGKRKDGIVQFAGKLEDLEEVKKDISKLGYSSSSIYSRKTKTSSGNITTNYAFCVNGSSLIVLLETLGTPRGKKVSQPYSIPQWLFKAELWQKRLFLASLFGCELRMPHRRLNRRGNFNAPVFPMAKSEELLDNGKLFLNDIKKLLSEFNVKVSKINQRRRHIAKDGLVTWALELILSSKADNLINLWNRVGFEYNENRRFLASIAVMYLKNKQVLLREKEGAINLYVPNLIKKGWSCSQITNCLVGNPLTKRFIESVYLKIRKGVKRIIPRIPLTFPTFNNFLIEKTEGLGKAGLVWDKIVKIKEIKFNDIVYDLTIDDENHNFIANGLLVSNCIGGVAAFDMNEGIISPGGVGYDINCSVRLLRTDWKTDEILNKRKQLLNEIFAEVPAGVGKGGITKISREELIEVVKKGAGWAIEKGYGYKQDIEKTEESGCLNDAEPNAVSERAYARGKPQLGTLGAGNHFLEIQKVDKIYNKEIASAFGIQHEGQVTVMIHCGSRGLGHQVASDYIQKMESKYGFKELPDRELINAPINSELGQQYYKAMCGAANFAFANKQMITHWVRNVFEKIMGTSNGMDVVYDVCHNIAKFEKHNVDGSLKTVCIHRKGATRSFGPGREEIPECYRDIGQPVIIPGSMGTASYLLVGTRTAEEISWGSTAHGAGRVASRAEALRTLRGEDVKRQLEAKGIEVKGVSWKGIAEEAPEMYKDIDEVARVSHELGIGNLVARLVPLGVMKG